MLSGRPGEMASGAESVPGSRQPSAFTRLLIRWNGLDAAGFAAWEFLPGMKFAERAAWWRDGAERPGAHEGLDICFYRTGDGRRLSLGAGARVPVVCPGEVVALVDDFLGRSVFVAHEITGGEGRRLHTVYGHLDPAPGLTPGGQLGEGDLVGTIAETSGRRGSVPPHLHLTVALTCREGGPEPLDWNALRDQGRVLLLDPLPVVCGRRNSFNPAFPAGS
jgi:hypothetical protein